MHLYSYFITYYISDLINYNLSASNLYTYGTNGSDLFHYCDERDFMINLSSVTHSDITDAFKSISKYLDDLCNTDTDFSIHSILALIHLLYTIK